MWPFISGFAVGILFAWAAGFLWLKIAEPAWSTEDLVSARTKIDAQQHVPGGFIPLTGRELAALTAHHARAPSDCREK